MRNKQPNLQSESRSCSPPAEANLGMVHIHVKCEGKVLNPSRGVTNGCDWNIRRPFSEGHHSCGDWFQLLISSSSFQKQMLIAVVKSKVIEFGLQVAIVG